MGIYWRQQRQQRQQRQLRPFWGWIKKVLSFFQNRPPGRKISISFQMKFFWQWRQISIIRWQAKKRIFCGCNYVVIFYDGAIFWKLIQGVTISLLDSVQSFAWADMATPSQRKKTENFWLEKCISYSLHKLIPYFVKLTPPNIQILISD